MQNVQRLCNKTSRRNRKCIIGISIWKVTLSNQHHKLVCKLELAEKSQKWSNILALVKTCSNMIIITYRLAGGLLQFFEFLPKNPQKVDFCDKKVAVYSILLQWWFNQERRTIDTDRVYHIETIFLTIFHINKQNFNCSRSIYRFQLIWLKNRRCFAKKNAITFHFSLTLTW